MSVHSWWILSRQLHLGVRFTFLNRILRMLVWHWPSRRASSSMYVTLIAFIHLWWISIGSFQDILPKPEGLTKLDFGQCAIRSDGVLWKEVPSVWIFFEWIMYQQKSVVMRIWILQSVSLDCTEILGGKTHKSSTLARPYDVLDNKWSKTSLP
jgi:hypothetical protein